MNVIFPLPLFVQSEDALNVLYVNVIAGIEVIAAVASAGVTDAAAVPAENPLEDVPMAVFVIV